MDMNLSCEAENLLLSQFAEQEEKSDMYSELLNFGDEDENLALSQFADRIERNLKTVNISDLNSSVLKDNHELDFTISDLLSESELNCVSQLPNLQLEEVDFNLTQDIGHFVDFLLHDDSPRNTPVIQKEQSSITSRFGNALKLQKEFVKEFRKIHENQLTGLRKYSTNGEIFVIKIYQGTLFQI